MMEIRKSSYLRASLLWLLVLILSCSQFVSSQSQVTILRRDIVIDLGDGLTTNAQLTYPSISGEFFPGILLVHGSGNTDMDEYLPPEVSDIEEGARPFLQIAEYLSNRGFAVLRYNKRGIGSNGTILDAGVVTNTTFQNLLQDAEIALEVLLQQPEVDKDDITILGHSEGTWIAPRIAIEDHRVKKIVLMSAGARNLYDILYFQIVERGNTMFEEIDDDHNGLLTIQEIIVLPSAISNQLIENSTGEWLWITGIDPNEDGFISIDEELIPRWNQTFIYLTTAEYPGSKWLQSHLTLESNLEIISDVTASVLILQGEGDTQTPVEEAFLLEQKLTEVGHPDHILITYPDLGHSFYPTEGLLQWLGPIEDYVLSDLATWLKAPERDLNDMRDQLTDSENIINDLQTQLDELKSELNQQASHLESLNEEWKSERSKLQNTIDNLEDNNEELQITLNSLKNLNYIAIGLALVAIIESVVIIFRKPSP
ncbi:MAG: alpha/beta fold hydrolase [Promethearchaeota archaeon]